MRPDYSIEFIIKDTNNDEIIVNGSTFIQEVAQYGEPVMGFPNPIEESAEMEFWRIMRQFRARQKAYEDKEYPSPIEEDNTNDWRDEQEKVEEFESEKADNYQQQELR